MPPWVVFALALALALAAVYELAARRYGWRLLAYWLAILGGIIAAEVGAEVLGWNFTRFGDLRLLPDLMGAVIVLLALWFLGL